jgi:hypothetical protein
LGDLSRQKPWNLRRKNTSSTIHKDDEFYKREVVEWI